MMQFPEDFLWGAATSAHQVEGNNTNNDWWEWEQRRTGAEPSGGACRHYEYYPGDFDLARSLAHTAHRFSLEWSRIEPREGEFDEAALAHYHDVICALRARGIEPVVTLHHFTNPLWFTRRGGWLSAGAPFFFARYAAKAARAFSGDVRYWITINEPNVYAYYAYSVGTWPPHVSSLPAARVVLRNFIRSHLRAYEAIRRIYREGGRAPARVSIAQNIQIFQPCKDSPVNRLAVFVRNRVFNLSFISALARRRALDFIGINYYSRSLVDARGWRMRNLLFDGCRDNCSRLKKNSLGWDIYPEGMYYALKMVSKFGLPVFILENGICADDDGVRWEFIRDHLHQVRRAMSAGVKVMGYIYWSLMDNFEWDKGFVPRFGLIRVDYATMERVVRESARKLAQVCARGRLE